MRRQDRALSEAQSTDFLSQAEVGRVAMAVDNEPYVIPVNYFYEDNRVYFHCAPMGRKLEMMGSNSRVCFEVDEMIAVKPGQRACEYGAYFRSVIAYGNASLMPEGIEKVRILNQLTHRYAPTASFAPVTEEDARSVGVVMIELTEVSGKGKLKNE
jgi:nitroimidazol reductase NimA-like FMN-containing flavoprotein (pyridoxamine 5'-phosphate oxidase superfamily)